MHVHNLCFSTAISPLFFSLCYLVYLHQIDVWLFPIALTAGPPITIVVPTIIPLPTWSLFSPPTEILAHVTIQATAVHLNPWSNSMCQILVGAIVLAMVMWSMLPSVSSFILSVFVTVCHNSKLGHCFAQLKTILKVIYVILVYVAVYLVTIFWCISHPLSDLESTVLLNHSTNLFTSILMVVVLGAIFVVVPDLYIVVCTYHCITFCFVSI